MKTSLIGAALAATLSAAGPAAAYTWPKCQGTDIRRHWAAEEAMLRLSSVSFSLGSPWQLAMAQVMTTWNDTPSQMEYDWIIEAGVAEDNGQSEVWWSSGITPPSMTMLEVDDDTCEIVEADVVFKSGISFTASWEKDDITPYGGSHRPFRTAAIHELGHVQGMGHTTDRYSVMGEDWDHITAFGIASIAYVGEDAVDGSIDTYGAAAGSHTNLGVVHWRRSGASGGLSQHTRTRVFNTAGVELAKFVASAEPVYRVHQGQKVQLEFTYENMGKTSPASSKVGYYLSTNNTISTTDTHLRNAEVTVSRGAPNTAKLEVAIPGWVTIGTVYYLGALIDPDGLSSELDAYNTTYTAIVIE
jgi:hypothetical protein